MYMKVLSAAALVLLAVTACEGREGAGGKEGPAGAVVTLTIGTDDTLGTPSAGQIEQFARLVAARTAGKVRIKPQWHAAGLNADDWDQAVARMVGRGELDMGMIPARAWDVEGVTSMNALQAPFLVTSDYLADRIAADPAMVTDLLSGLGRIGLTGLALVPENERHPFGVKAALTKPADFAGKFVRAPRSDVTYALFTAYGAKPDDLPGDAQGRAIMEGRLAGIESSFPLASSVAVAKIATANVTFYTKMNSIVIRTSVLNGLAPQLRAAVDRAAKETAGWAALHRTAEADGAAAHCKQGGTVVLADQDDVRALERAAKPVYATLEQDAGTAALIARIQALKARAPLPVVAAPCGGTAAATSLKGGKQGRFPEGVYRAEVPLELFLQQGVNRSDAEPNAGVSTLTFKDGTWRHHVGGDSPDLDCHGPYSVKDGRIALAFREMLCGSAGGDLFSAAWSVVDGGIRFVDVVAGQPDEGGLMSVLFGSTTWRKIG